jgi:hypothetical protein
MLGMTKGCKKRHYIMFVYVTWPRSVAAKREASRGNVPPANQRQRARLRLIRPFRALIWYSIE